MEYDLPLNYKSEDYTRSSMRPQGVEFFTIQSPRAVTIAAVQDEQGAILLFCQFDERYLETACMRISIIQADNSIRDICALQGNTQDVDKLFDALRTATAAKIRSLDWVHAVEWLFDRLV